ncbi:MAG: thymidylate synthase [Jatrophihabitans sp.]
MHYREVAARTPDSQYRELVGRILEFGEDVPSRQGPMARTLIQQSLHYDLANGFPVIADRSLKSFWTKPIGELCAFINGATTLDEFESFGCGWWRPWATEAKTTSRGLPPGDIGPGSYGGAFRRFPTSEGPPFDQFEHLIQQIVELPDIRTHFVSPWIPQYQVRGKGKTPRTTIAPCHGWVHVRILRERIHLHMYQRSGDVPVGVPSNMIQYAALVLMIEQLTGYQAGVYYHTISDAHVYHDQIDSMRELLTRPARRLPTVELTDAGRQVGQLRDFRAEHFSLADYEPHPGIANIPVAP